MPVSIQDRYDRYQPYGLVDSIDGNTAPPGAMAMLAELMPSPNTVGLWLPRPASFPLTKFAGFTAPGYVSVYKNIGTRIWGMIASGRNAGQDEPFCYDTSTGAFVTISGVTAANTPTSPATTGTWTPPTIDAVGSFIVITHPGFNGVGSNFFGLISGASGATPSWAATNTAVTALPSVPTGVASFNGRAYFIIKNTLYYSDSLVPGTITAATQTLTCGGPDSVLAVNGEPFFTTQSGGIIAALLAFKAAQIWQVTGDPTTANLVLNKLIDGVGTNSPRSIANTPNGTIFMAADGIRTLNLSGQVSDPNADLSLPFQQAFYPSRVAAAWNTGIYRICTNGLVGGSYKTREYWLNTQTQRWVSGPNALAYDCVTNSGNAFVLSSAAVPGQLQQANVLPGALDGFTENGTSLAFTYQTVLVAESTSMKQVSLVEASIFMGFDASLQITCSVLNQANAVLATQDGTKYQTVLTTPVYAPTNATNWLIPWFSPAAIPSRCAFQLTGMSSPGLELGTLNAHWQYQTQNNAIDITSITLPNPIDFGLITDTVIQTAMDWGSVIDIPALATVDFGQAGSI